MGADFSDWGVLWLASIGLIAHFLALAAGNPGRQFHESPLIHPYQWGLEGARGLPHPGQGLAPPGTLPHRGQGLLPPG